MMDLKNYMEDQQLAPSKDNFVNELIIVKDTGCGNELNMHISEIICVIPQHSWCIPDSPEHNSVLSSHD